MLLANFNRKEHVRHRAVSLRQHGFLVFTVIISVSGVRLLDWAPHHKCRYSRWNFTNRLFLTEGFTTSGLRCHLGFLYVGSWQHVCIPVLQLWTKQVYDTKNYMFLIDVAHFWATFSDHIFLSIFVINVFVSHIALPHIHGRCPWKYEISRRKCVLLLIGRFRIRHTIFRWFPKNVLPVFTPPCWHFQ